ncbi:hypothetical protein Tco_0147344 [Tanacetum coccineum]
MIVLFHVVTHLTELRGRKKSKPESTLNDNTVFDDQDADHGMEYMETKEAVDEGRQSGETEEVKFTDDTEVVEDKGSGDKGGVEPRSTLPLHNPIHESKKREERETK